MKKYLLLLITLSGAFTLQAQKMKLGNNPGTLNTNALLELESTNKGLLLPRLALDSTYLATPLTAHVQGMLVYNTATVKDVTPGYYYNDGTKWNKIGQMAANFEPTLIVYCNAATPASATVFCDDLDNCVHDATLMAQSNYLYVGSDNSTWLWKGTNYQTYTAPVGTEWTFSASTTDAGTSKTGDIARTGSVAIGINQTLPYTSLRVSNTKIYNSPGGQQYSYATQPNSNISSSGNIQLFQAGVHAGAFGTHTSGTNSGAVTGVVAYGYRTGTGNNGTLARADGVQATAGHNSASSGGSGTTTNVTGVRSTVNLGWGTITNAYNFYSTAVSTGATVTNPWGIYINQGSHSAIGNYLPGTLGVATASTANELSVNGAAAKPGGGSWAVFSDARIKKNVTDYTEGLSLLKKVHTVNFQYNENYFRIHKTSEAAKNKLMNTTFQGVIAQELQAIAPDMVTKIAEWERDMETGAKKEGTETEILQVDPNKFTYALINAVKELSAEIDELKKEIETLKSK